MEILKCGHYQFAEVINEKLIFITARRIRIYNPLNFAVEKEIFGKGHNQYKILVIKSNRFICQQLRGGKVYFTLYDLSKDKSNEIVIEDYFILGYHINDANSCCIIISAKRLYVWNFEEGSIESYEYEKGSHVCICSSNNWTHNRIILNISSNSDEIVDSPILFNVNERTFEELGGKFSDEKYNFFYFKRYDRKLNLFLLSSRNRFQVYNAKEEKLLEIMMDSDDLNFIADNSIVDDSEYLIFYSFNAIFIYSKIEKRMKLYQEERISKYYGALSPEQTHTLGYIREERKIIVTMDKVKTIHVDELYAIAKEVPLIGESLL